MKPDKRVTKCRHEQNDTLLIKGMCQKVLTKHDSNPTKSGRAVPNQALNRTTKLSSCKAKSTNYIIIDPTRRGAAALQHGCTLILCSLPLYSPCKRPKKHAANRHQRICEQRRTLYGQLLLPHGLDLLAHDTPFPLLLRCSLLACQHLLQEATRQLIHPNSQRLYQRVIERFLCHLQPRVQLLQGVSDPAPQPVRPDDQVKAQKHFLHATA